MKNELNYFILLLFLALPRNYFNIEIVSLTTTMKFDLFKYGREKNGWLYILIYL